MIFPRVAAGAAALVAALALAACGSSSGSSAGPGPATGTATRPAATTTVPASPRPASPVNDYSCRPAAPHPYPVVLVHGTAENSGQWAGLAPTLTAKGYCVFALDYGNQGTGDIATSAGQLKPFIDKVLASTGVAKVDIVGHSQGGMMPRYYMKFLGGATKVHQLIGLAASNYGTRVPTPPASACPACAQQAQGSQFLDKLNAGTDTVPGVSFTVIETTKDEIVQPYTNTFLHGPGATNELVQKFCPADASGHISLADSDRNAWQLVYNALDPAHAKPVVCVPATDGQ